VSGGPAVGYWTLWPPFGGSPIRRGVSAEKAKRADRGRRCVPVHLWRTRRRRTRSVTMHPSWSESWTLWYEDYDYPASGIDSSVTQPQSPQLAERVVSGSCHPRRANAGHLAQRPADLDFSGGEDDVFFEPPRLSSEAQGAGRGEHL